MEGCWVGSFGSGLARVPQLRAENSLAADGSQRFDAATPWDAGRCDADLAPTVGHSGAFRGLYRPADNRNAGLVLLAEEFNHTL